MKYRLKEQFGSSPIGNSRFYLPEGTVVEFQSEINVRAFPEFFEEIKEACPHARASKDLLKDGRIFCPDCGACYAIKPQSKEADCCYKNPDCPTCKKKPQEKEECKHGEVDFAWPKETLGGYLPISPDSSIKACGEPQPKEECMSTLTRVFLQKLKDYYPGKEFKLVEDGASTKLLFADTVVYIGILGSAEPSLELLNVLDEHFSK